MNSPNSINYETRPLKFVERKMLLSSLINICNRYNEDYQYIGFGGVSFTDFKLFHKELHLNEMYSIEGGNKINSSRVEFNNPFPFIKLKFGQSSSELSKLDLSKKAIVWLDYDNDLDTYMFEDLSILFRKLPKGSVYLMTCNRELKNHSTGKEYQVKDFKDKFKGFHTFELKNTDFSGINNSKTIRKMLLKLINETLHERSDDDLKFHQLFNFRYQENRGARMFTFGGIIEDSDFSLENSNINNQNFIRTNDHEYTIELPNLTLKEMDYINNKLDDYNGIDSGIVEKSQFDKYIKVYKFLPNFMDVRM